MAKKTTSYALTLRPRDRGTPIGRWLYGALREGILNGRLRPGARLPSTRDMAAHYGIARGTVVEAYDELRWEGYLESRVGSGTRVSVRLPESLLRHPDHGGTRRGGRGGRTPAPRAQREWPRRLSTLGREVRPFDNLPAGPARAFRAHQGALDLFPVDVWSQIAGRRLRRDPSSLLAGCGPLGYPPLREAVAEYLGTSRGVVCTPEQVVIVSGVQEAIDLAGRLLVDPGDRVAVENPCYDGATLVLSALGAEVVRIPVDDEGLCVDHLEGSGARLVYATPAHQFPLGVAMSLARRLALLQWAAATDAVVFEDDYDSEFRYAGRPLPALQGLDLPRQVGQVGQVGQVLFAGSFNKVLFPALRVGYVVVPDDLVDRFAALASITHRHAPLLEQVVVTDFIADGHFGRHLRRMREVYSERLDVLHRSAREHLAGLLEISDVEAGLQTVGWLAPGLDDAEAVERAAARGLEVLPTRPYGTGGAGRGGLHLGFAAVEPDEIRRGVRELAIALEALARRRPG